MLLAGAALAVAVCTFADRRDRVPEAATSALRLAADPVRPPAPPPLPLPPTDMLPRSPGQARRINAAVPMAPGPRPAAPPFRFRGSPDDRARAIDCLASAGYYEAGDDPEGQRAVAQVVLNRVRHPAFPATICGVVYQGAERETGCQFTFTCDGAMARAPVPRQWAKARVIAAQALDGRVFGAVGLATHYHTDWVVPFWSARLAKIARVQTHLFFRWHGSWGRPGAFHRTVSTQEPAIARLAALSPSHGQTPPPPFPVQAKEPTRDGPPASAFPALAGLELRGGELRIAHPQGDAFGFLLPRSHPGAFGLLALDLCRERPFCKLVGWIDPHAVPAGFPIPYEARRRMAFLYVRDAGRRAEIMAWDCTLFPRPDAAQCLAGELTRWDAILGGEQAGQRGG